MSCGMTQNCVITARGETVEATSIGWVKDGISAHVRWLHAGQQAPLIHDSYKMSLTCTHMDVDTDRQTWMPTYTHTRHSHRHTQLQVHPHRRFLSLPRTHSYVRADGLTFEPSAWHGVCQMALRGQRTGMKCGEGRRGGVGWKIGLFPSRPIFFVVFFFFPRRAQTDMCTHGLNYHPTGHLRGSVRARAAIERGLCQGSKGGYFLSLNFTSWIWCVGYAAKHQGCILHLPAGSHLRIF